jgi:hypothetical protein
MNEAIDILAERLKQASRAQTRIGGFTIVHPEPQGDGDPREPGDTFPVPSWCDGYSADWTGPYVSDESQDTWSE